MRNSYSKLYEGNKLITFICWKDIRHPSAGGAEILIHELSKKLLSTGYKVVHLVPGFKKCKLKEEIDGVKIIRLGECILYFYILPLYFFKHLKDETDILIDVFCCFSSFTWLFFKKKKYIISSYSWLRLV